METFTAAAIATILLTKALEKLGESLGEKVPEVGSQIWSKVTQLKELLTSKAPETSALVDAVTNVPSLSQSQPDVFGIPALSQKLEQIAAENSDINILIAEIGTEVFPSFPETFRQKLLTGVKAKSLRIKGLEQKGNTWLTDKSLIRNALNSEGLKL